MSEKLQILLNRNNTQIIDYIDLTGIDNLNLPLIRSMIAEKYQIPAEKLLLKFEKDGFLVKIMIYLLYKEFLIIFR